MEIAETHIWYHRFDPRVMGCDLSLAHSLHHLELPLSSNLEFAHVFHSHSLAHTHTSHTHTLSLSLSSLSLSLSLSLTLQELPQLAVVRSRSC